MFRWLSFLAYVAWTAYVVAHHEPWRDEADVWLLARDVQIPELLKILNPAGTPAFWYFPVKVLTFLGLPFVSLQWLNWLMGCGATALLLWKSPFPRWLSVVLPFTYFLGYEYVAIARVYAPAAFFLFLAASLFSARNRHPLLFVGVLSAAMHTTIPAFFVTAPVLGWFCLEVLRGKSFNRRFTSFLAAALAVFSTLLFLWHMAPKTGGHVEPGWFPHYEPVRGQWAVKDAFFPYFPDHGFTYGKWILLAIGASLLIKPYALFAWLGGTGGVLYLLMFKIYGSIRHSGLIWLFAVFSVWILLLEVRKRKRHSKGFRATLVLLLLGWSSYYSAQATWSKGWLDIENPFSAARAMALWMKDAGLEGQPIAAFPAPHCEGLLPYLPKQEFFYAGENRMGTYMRWDQTFEEGLHVSPAQALERARQKWSDRPFYWLSVDPVPNEVQQGLELIHVETGNIIIGEEHFHLYRVMPRR